MGKIRDKLLRMDQYQDSLKMLMEKRLKAARHELEVDIERLKGLSPLDRLKTGYSYVSDKDGKNIRSIGDVKTGDELSVYVSDGLVKANVTGTEEVGFY
jgi:exodeoxyribonuclease VII large subunit